MTKMAMKFPQCIEKKLIEIIKIDKSHERDLIITLFKLFTDILAQYSMIKTPFIGRRFISKYAANIKNIKSVKTQAVDSRP